MLDKPESISSNETKSRKWDELTAGRDFQTKDIPTLELLCQWYAIVEKCIDDMTFGDEIQVAYQNNLADLKALPQVGMLKQASGEIRALNKQLGINDEAEDKPKKKKNDTFAVIALNRQRRAAAAQ